MGLFGCKHEFEEQSRVYHRGKRLANFKNMTVEEVQRLEFGATIIELKCKHCGRHTTEKLVGKHLDTPELSEVKEEFKRKAAELHERIDELERKKKSKEKENDESS